jgi:tetratricopeptide (TPR) repeat protein
MSPFDECGDQPPERSCLSSGTMGHLNLGVRGTSRSTRALAFAIAAVLILCAAGLTGLNKTVAGASSSPAGITVDYPLNGSVFPPDMAAPTFEWRDPAESAVSWQIDVAFGDGSPGLRVTSKGEGLKIGEIDARCVSSNNKLPTLTPEQANGHAWKPDATTWAAIRKRAVEHPATITISGYPAENQSQPISRGAMQLTVSRDPVGAPIFYRDVPLMPSATEKGVIKPLAPAAIPLIEWRMRNISEPSSHVVMTDLHSCANCHSFSRDGKTLGLDMDGPQNDKGLYAVVPVAEKMTVRTRDMISWASFSGEMDSQLRVGFMSQVSPDGKYVMTTIKPPGTKSWQFYYVANFTDYRFLQVFYPTRGILAWYDREAKKLRPLPGADDPNLVQASAVWSPDGKYLVFARAGAKDPNPADGKMAAYANDPAEVQIQYDLYRIPFNGGRGGTPERIVGASQNGMSNSFAKVSPDGKWIVFVQAHNGEIMRPDGKLYIVPAAGGQARLMTCNTALMNSWHSFSPNGRWLVFSSKSRSPYTQLFLTHIDENGNDTPAILIENSTAANRAVNLPEFVNMNPSGIEHIDTPAVDFYKQFDVAADLTKKGEYDAAIAEWVKALAMQPNDERAHYGFGQTYLRADRIDDAIAQFRESIRVKPHYAEAHDGLGLALGRAGLASESMDQFRLALDDNPSYAEAHNNLGLALGRAGNLSESMEQFHLALKDNPSYAEAHNNLGSALLDEHHSSDAVLEFKSALEANPGFAEAHNNLGQAYAAEEHVDDALGEYRKAIEIDPKYAFAYNNMGLAMAMKGDLDEALAAYRKAIEINPKYAFAYNNMGLAMAAKGNFDEAIADLTEAVELDPANAGAEDNLGHALMAKGNVDEAIPHFKRALDLGPETADYHTNLGIALAKKGRMADAIPHFERALALSPNAVDAHYYLGKALVMSGRAVEGLAYWRQALRKDPDNLQVLNDTAWVLATSRDASLRNGDEALPLAEHAVQLTSAREPGILGTLAAVYAETGRFDKAVELEQRATGLATQQGNAALAQSLNARLALYQEKTPIRQ